MTAPLPHPAATPPSRAAWLLFAPIAAWVGLRWVLAWITDRNPPPPAWALVPFAGAESAWDWLPWAAGVLAGLAVLLLAVWWLARRGQRRGAAWLAAGAWLLLWGAACAGQLYAFMNLYGRVPQPPLAAELIGARAKPPSLRALGGTLWVLSVDGEAAPQQLLVEDGAAARVPLHARVQLTWARGRWGGCYVSAWDMLALPPSAPSAPPP